jgi:regulator of replication initiation timing
MQIVKKAVTDHLQSGCQQHTLLLLKAVEQLQHSCEDLKTENQALKQENADLKCQLQRLTAVSFEFLWPIDSWSQKLQEAKDGGNNDLYSDTFYTGYPGYRLSLNLCPNGDNKSGHVSLYVVVLQGHYDRLLVWPFACKCKLFILDQHSDGKNWSRTLDPLRQASRAAFDMPTSSQNDGTGWTRYISHRDLYSRSYIKDDSLLIKAEIHFQ